MDYKNYTILNLYQNFVICTKTVVHLYLIKKNKAISMVLMW